MKHTQYSERRHSDMSLFIILSGVAHAILAFVVVNYLTTALSSQHASLYSDLPELTISLLKRDVQVSAIDAISRNDLSKLSANNESYHTSGNSISSGKTSHQTITEPQQSLPKKPLPQAHETNLQRQAHTLNNSTDKKSLDISDNKTSDFAEGTDSIQIPTPTIDVTDSKLAAVQTGTFGNIPTEPAKQQDISGNENNIHAQRRVLRRINDELKKHISYPLLARKRGWAGIVTIGFQFTDNGLIHNIHLSKSSGYPLLDQSALDAFQQITHIYFANSLHAEHRRVLQLPVDYRLVEG